MMEAILPDDLVVVHRQQEAHSGEIVVALFEDEVHREDPAPQGRSCLADAGESGLRPH